jgi:hypothetical protein
MVLSVPRPQLIRCEHSVEPEFQRKYSSSFSAEKKESSHALFQHETFARKLGILELMCDLTRRTISDLESITRPAFHFPHLGT